MKKVKSKKFGLTALSNFYIVEEDPIELTPDKGSGLTKEVANAIKGGLLVIPEIGEFYANKFPFVGTIVAKGDETRHKDLKIGTRVMFARLGGQRWQKDDKQYVTIQEDDI